MITYFVHATSMHNEDGIRSGWDDAPLSTQGIVQARALASVVVGRNFDRVYTSDLERAAHTASLAFPTTPLRRDRRLREMNYGVLNGAHVDAFPDDEDWCIEHRFDGGECCLDVQARVADFLACEYRAGDDIAIVSHRYPQLALEVLCNGCSWPDALRRDWRMIGQWQPGWDYDVCD